MTKRSYLTLLFMTSELVINAQNSWTAKKDYGGFASFSAVSFSIGAKGYVGTGTILSPNVNLIGITKDFWEYDPVNDVWSQKADFQGGYRTSATGFSVGGKGYIGMGLDDNGNNKKDFWEYDPVANSWVQKADFGGTARREAVSFCIGNKGYVGTGMDNDVRKDFWEYDPVTNSWVQKADFPGPSRTQAVSFSIGKRGYIGSGRNNAAQLVLYFDYWEYNSLSNTWRRTADLLAPRSAACGFGIGLKGYIGLGTDAQLNYRKDFWEYNPVNDNWIRKTDFAGLARVFSTGFSINNKGYLGLGGQIEERVPNKDFWEYSPSIPCSAATFNAAATISNLNAPFRIFLKDFNADRIPDLFVSNQNSIVVHVGDGSGGFNSVAIVTGFLPGDFTVVDLNADGYFDIATTNLLSANIVVCMGNSSGFGAGTSFPTGERPSSIVHGDFNKDGKEDLAVANVNTDNISILLGNGAGAFGPMSNFAVGDAPSGLVTTDFNSDGILDLATTNFVSNNVSVLLGNGIGAFGPATNYNVGNPGSIISSDFNGDGKPDLAVVNQFPSNTCSILLGSGNGSFGAATNFSVSLPKALGCADFNGDGKSDLAISHNSGSNVVSIFLGDGNGGFVAASSFPVGNFPTDLRIADLNSDGGVDIIVANNVSNNLSVYLNSCNVNTHPSIQCPEDITVANASGQCNQIVELTAIAAGSPTPAIIYKIGGNIISSPHTFPVGQTTVEVTASNGIGSDTTCSFSVTVQDKEAPQINCPANITVNSDAGMCAAAVSFGATASDNCDAQPQIYYASNAGNVSSGTSFAVGVNTVTVIATDASGNSSSCSFTITVVDKEAPQINCPANITVNNDAGNCGAVVNFSATASDNCVGASQISYATSTGVVNSGDNFPVGTTTIIATAIDGAGNSSTCSFTITVEDKEAPKISCPVNIIVSNDAGNCGAVVNFGVTASDNCVVPQISYANSTWVVSSGDYFLVGTTTLTATARDGSGNSSTCSFTITVEDKEAPKINCPVNIKVNNDANMCAALVNFGATASDNCDEHPQINYATNTGSVSSGVSFPVGVTTVTVKATDASGNSSSCSFTITVEDKIAPSITCPAPQTVYLGPSCTASLPNYKNLATASDNCTPSGSITISQYPVIATVLSGTGSQTVTLKATDAAGNTATCSFTVTSVDNVKPTITCPATQTVYLGATCTALLLNYTTQATVSDNCTASGSITITQSPAANTLLSGTGTQTVTMKATDAAGNTSTCSFTVIKVDKVPPVINNVSQSVVALSPPNHKMRAVTINYSLTDNCGGTISSVLSVGSNEPVSGTGDGDTAPDWEVINDHDVKLRAERSGSGDGRVYTITIKATDASGNTSTSSVEVRVTHNITVPYSGQSFKLGSTVNFAGEFWDKPGNNHTATWFIDDNTSVKGTVTEPTATKNGKVTGSYKFTTAGVFKLQMNTKDQNNLTSYANTNGDLEAIIVIYDPNGGYAYGGGYFNSPAGAVTSNVTVTGKASYGFSVNYFKGATYPKGETQFEFKVGEFEFNALNFEYMSIAGAKAQMKGTGKITGGQSGINFILTVIDGQFDGTGIDKIRMKIYNKNTMQVFYDNQPGASDAINPTMQVQENSTVVISGSSNNNNLTKSNQSTTTVEQEAAPWSHGLEVKATPNPSNTSFRITLNSNNLKEPVKLTITDMLGRIIETRTTNAGQIIIGEKYRSGTYIVRIIQGSESRQLKLIKLPD